MTSIETPSKGTFRIQTLPAIISKKFSTTIYPSRFCDLEGLNYDGFSHLTDRNSNVWSDFYSITDSYSNNRRTYWDYDASGNLLGTGEITCTYDAAGSIGTVTTYDPQSTTTRTTDGEGQQVKTVETTYNDSSQSWTTTTTHYVRSTVLGKVLTELNESGAKHRTFVYTGNQVLATQEIIPYYQTQGVTWEHRDPSNASYRAAYVTGDLSQNKELDPTGADVTHAPLIFPNPPDEGDPSLLPYPSFSSPARPGVAYSIDGIPVSADYFMQTLDLVSHGSGSLWLVEASARASQQVIGYRNKGVSWGRPFDATYDANGHMTSMHMGAVASDLAGINYGNISAIYDNSWAFFSLLPQDTLQSRHQMTPEDVAKLRKEIKNLLQGKCKELLEEMNKRIKGGVFSNDLLDVFDYMDRNHTLVRDDTIGRGGSGGGNAVDGKPFKAGMTLNFHWFQSPAWVSLEELTHANGTAGVQYISHENMAQAAIDAAQFLKIDLNRLKNTTSPKAEVLDPKTGDSKNSQLFQAILSLECK
jgi:hypothetical protein